MTVVSQGWDEIIKWYNAYNEKLIVVRIDSALSEDVETMRRLGKQIAFLRKALNLKIIAVRGSRKDIATTLRKSNLPVNIDMRTKMPLLDEASIVIVNEALRQQTNRIVEDFKKACKESITPICLAAYEGKAVEVAPPDDSLKKIELADFTVNTLFLNTLFESREKLYVPIIYPICAAPKTNGTPQKHVSVDADLLALAIAKDMEAHRLIICSDVLGVFKQDGALIPEIFVDEIRDLVSSSALSKNMSQRLFSAGNALEEMKKGAIVIMDVRYPDSLLNELLSDQGGGTLIRHRPERPTKRTFSFVPASDYRSTIAI